MKRDCPSPEPIQISGISHRLRLVDADAESHGVERRHGKNRKPSGHEQAAHDGDRHRAEGTVRSATALTKLDAEEWRPALRDVQRDASEKGNCEIKVVFRAAEIVTISVSSDQS